jgi:hypothetical protein
MTETDAVDSWLMTKLRFVDLSKSNQVGRVECLWFQIRPDSIAAAPFVSIRMPA